MRPMLAGMGFGWSAVASDIATAVRKKEGQSRLMTASERSVDPKGMKGLKAPE